QVYLGTSRPMHWAIYSLSNTTTPPLPRNHPFQMKSPMANSIPCSHGSIPTFTSTDANSQGKHSHNVSQARASNPTITSNISPINTPKSTDSKIIRGESSTIRLFSPN